MLSLNFDFLLILYSLSEFGRDFSGSIVKYIPNFKEYHVCCIPILICCIKIIINKIEWFWKNRIWCLKVLEKSLNFMSSFLYESLCV